MEDLFAYVDQHFDRMIGELQEFCAIRSVADDRLGITGASDWVRNKLLALRADTQVHPIPGGNPLIYGRLAGGVPQTVLFYNHYDVVPEGPIHEWRHIPFRPTVEGDKIYARGVSDNKGGLTSRLHAIETVLAVRGSLPCGVKFLVEGDEEVGSPSMKQFSLLHREEFRNMLDAELCIWENGRKDADGHPWARFGVRATCTVDLSVTTANKDAHARTGAELLNAAWRLVWALASLKDAKDRILIDGFYDDVQPTTGEDLEVLNAFPLDEEAYLQRMGLDSFLNHLTGLELKERIYMKPTLNICGVESGEPHQGMRSIVPHTARARVTFLMVPNQRAETVLERLKLHLERHGFGDVKVSSRSEGAPVRTPVTSPYRGVIQRAAARVYEKPLVTEITQVGSGPGYLLRDVNPDLPIIGIGPANTGSSHHGPDENLSLTDYKQAVKHVIALLYEMAGQAGSPAYPY